MTRRHLSASALAFAIAVAGACGDDDDSSPEPVSSTHSGEVDLHAYAIDLFTEIDGTPAGVGFVFVEMGLTVTNVTNRPLSVAPGMFTVTTEAGSTYVGEELGSRCWADGFVAETDKPTDCRIVFKMPSASPLASATYTADSFTATVSYSCTLCPVGTCGSPEKCRIPGPSSCEGICYALDFMGKQIGCDNTGCVAACRAMELTGDCFRSRYLYYACVPTLPLSDWTCDTELGMLVYVGSACQSEQEQLTAACAPE